MEHGKDGLGKMDWEEDSIALLSFFSVGMFHGIYLMKIRHFS